MSFISARFNEVMKDKPANPEVEETYRYGSFSFLSGNRPIDKNHVDRLVKSMKKKLIKSPIIVNNDMEIIDGQHRFLAAEILAEKIYFIRLKGVTITDVALLNSNSKSWSMSNYSHMFETLGNENYHRLELFIERYGLSHDVSFNICTLGNLDSTSLKNGRPAFKQGHFKFNDFEGACERVEKILGLAKYYSGYKRRTFINAMIRALRNENFNYDKFIKKLEKQPMALIHCIRTADYLTVIEGIYNYGSRNKDNLIKL